jgi:hypothetical protein
MACGSLSSQPVAIPIAHGDTHVPEPPVDNRRVGGVAHSADDVVSVVLERAVLADLSCD